MGYKNELHDNNTELQNLLDRVDSLRNIWTKFTITLSGASSFASMKYNGITYNSSGSLRVKAGEPIYLYVSGSIYGYGWIYLNGTLVAQSASNALGGGYTYYPQTNANIEFGAWSSSTSPNQRGGTIYITETT